MSKDTFPVNKLSTSNLSEVGYLMERNHRIVGVRLDKGAYGIQELFVSMEGENIELDHKIFLGNGTVALKKVPDVLEAIQNQIWKDQEAAL